MADISRRRLAVLMVYASTIAIKIGRKHSETTTTMAAAMALRLIRMDVWPRRHCLVAFDYTTITSSLSMSKKRPAAIVLGALLSNLTERCSPLAIMTLLRWISLMSRLGLPFLDRQQPV